MKISTLALLSSATMAFSIPNDRGGTGWSMKREKEPQIKGAMSPTALPVINEGIKYSSISGNLKVVEPKPSESEDDDDSELILIPRSVSNAQESEWPEEFNVRNESEQSEDYDDSDSILSPRDIPDNNNEIKEKFVALEAELRGIAQKVYDEEKLNVSRYLAVESEIIQYFRYILLSSNEEANGETEELFNKVVIAFRKLNSRIGDVCYAGHDPHGYCSAFSASVFFTKAQGVKRTLRFLLDEFKDDRHIKDPFNSAYLVPNLVKLYKSTSMSLMELGNGGTNHWLNGNRAGALAEFEAAKSDLGRLTPIMQQYNLV